MEIALPSGLRVAFPVESRAYSPRQGTAVVVKDVGDDPDVTHGAHLTATVRWRAEPGVTLEGGEGVGVVTKLAWASRSGSLRSRLRRGP